MTREQHIQTWRERSLQIGYTDGVAWKIWRETVLLYKLNPTEWKRRAEAERQKDAA